jgi:hypothetical protein
MHLLLSNVNNILTETGGESIGLHQMVAERLYSRF